MKARYFILLFSALLLSGPVYAADIAIIVNPQNPVNEVTFVDIKKIFKQDYHELGGKKVDLILREPDSPEMKIILKKIYRMSDRGLKKFWLAKLFKGEISRLPKVLESNEAVKHSISRAPNQIGFIDVSFVNGSVKVLRIDGKLPGEEGYILNGR
jgi:ABC-type phosphate transport system substrate-binding protein